MEKWFFQQVVLAQLDANVQRNDARHTPYTFHKKWLKIDHGYKCITWIITFLEDNICDLSDLGLSDEFLVCTSNGQHMEKNDKLDSLKLKTCTLDSHH